MASSTMLSSAFVAKMVLMVALIFMASTPNPVTGSSITLWTGAGCGGVATRFDKCGCSSIPPGSGYEFGYTGQTAAVYNDPACRGVAHTRFNANVRACNPVGWRSIFIQC